MTFSFSIPDALHSLDSAGDFLVTHGRIVGSVALVSFILGWCFGGLLWRRYKRRFRTAEATMESLKNEAAQLKRCIAGQALRAQGSGGTQERAPLPPAKPFTVWTADDCEPQPARLPWPPSAAFTLWTREDFLPVAPPSVLPVKTSSGTVTLPEDLSPASAFLHQSRAFTLWTQPLAGPGQTVPGITQHHALAALVRSRVEVPALPTLTLDMEPLPAVPAFESDAQAQKP